jgi:hypothetical protein
VACPSTVKSHARALANKLVLRVALTGLLAFGSSRFEGLELRALADAGAPETIKKYERERKRRKEDDGNWANLAHPSNSRHPASGVPATYFLLLSAHLLYAN